MMTDKDVRLIEYALGTLPELDREALERELAADAGLRAALVEVQSTLDVLDDGQPPVTPPASVADRLMSSVAGSGGYDAYVDRVADLFDLAKSRARDILSHLRNVTDEPWIPGDLPGIRLLHFDGGDRVAALDCGLVRLDAGVAFPNHRHLADEWALMLEGEIIEDSGARFLPGDVVFKAAGTSHGFSATADTPAAFAVLTRIDALDFS